MKKLLFLFCGIVFLTACKDQYKTCHNAVPNIYIYGYDSIQKDSIIISSYDKGSNFMIKNSDSLILYSQAIHLQYGVDSFWIGIGKWHQYLDLYENYDWRYTVLHDRNHVDVTDAVREYNKTTINHPDAACNSPIVKASINGQVVENKDGIKAIYLIKP